MKTLIIYAHPNDKSYNASILETVKENLSSKHELKILDLYKEKFDPVLRFDTTRCSYERLSRFNNLGRSVDFYFSNLVEWNASYLERIY